MRILNIQNPSLLICSIDPLPPWMSKRPMMLVFSCKEEWKLTFLYLYHTCDPFLINYCLLMKMIGWWFCTVSLAYHFAPTWLNINWKELKAQLCVDVHHINKMLISRWIKSYQECWINLRLLFGSFSFNMLVVISKSHNLSMQVLANGFHSHMVGFLPQSDLVLRRM